MATKPIFKDLLDAEVRKLEETDDTIIRAIFDEISPVLKEKGTRVEFTASTLYVYANVTIMAYMVDDKITAYVRLSNEPSFSLRHKPHEFDHKEDFLLFIAKRVARNYSKFKPKTEDIPTKG